MKLIHLSDLHLGKRVNEYSMLEDQEYILSEIIDIIDREAPDGVIIAGDVYDKSVPSAEAVCLLDDFLTRLAERELQVFVISGNHDSPERMAFGSRLLDRSGIHVSRVYDGKLESYTLACADMCAEVYLLPFIKPAHVRRFFDGREITTYTDAVRCALSAAELKRDRVNILVTHQFVTGAARSESEELSVGGSDNVDVSAFDGFDYVALGHIHSPQSCSFERVRYCGTPLKYSFSEAKDRKSVTVVEFSSDKALKIRTVPLKPMRDMIELRGKYDELMLKSFYEGKSYSGDYVHITLTDEEDVIDAIGKLRVVYRNLMKLDYDNARTASVAHIDAAAAAESRSPLELFLELYELQNNRPMTEEQVEFVSELMEQISESGE